MKKVRNLLIVLIIGLFIVSCSNQQSENSENFNQEDRDSNENGGSNTESDQALLDEWLNSAEVVEGDDSSTGEWLKSLKVDQEDDSSAELNQEGDSSLNTWLTEPLAERPSAVWLEKQQEYAEFTYRLFLQNPQEAVWGPDGYLYVADGGGRHIVRIAQDGTMDDLGIWKTNKYMQEFGPNALAFDSAGNLYFNAGSFLFRLNTDGSTEKLFNDKGGMIRSITIDADDTLYYSLNSGLIYRWNPDGEDDLISQGIHTDPNVTIGPNNILYVSDPPQHKIYAVDLETNEHSILIDFFEDGFACNLAIDAEGDIWSRATSSLLQISPGGEIKPYKVNNLDDFNWHLAGGLAFDGEGNLWVTDGTGNVVRLDVVEQGVPDPEFNLEHLIYSFETSDLGVSSTGEVYSDRLIPGELLRHYADGTTEIVASIRDQGRNAVAVNNDDIPYFGLDGRGEIVYYENETLNHFADIKSSRMVFGADNNLYAVIGNWGKKKQIAKVTGVDQYSIIAEKIDGDPLGSNEVHLARAMDNGLFVLSEESCNLYFMDFEGEGHLLYDIVPHCEFSIIASSPTTGRVFFLSHENTLQDNPFRYSLYEILNDGTLDLLSPQIPGDPWAMVVSADGNWLYVAEVGAINKIPVSN